MKLFLCSHFSSVGSLIKEEIDNKKVAFIPTASLREGYTGYVGSARKLFNKLGAAVTEIDISTEAYLTIQSVFEDADVIYFTGGNSFFLMDQLRKTGADFIARHRKTLLYSHAKNLRIAMFYCTYSAQICQCGIISCTHAKRGCCIKCCAAAPFCNITLRPSGHPDARAVCVSMRRTVAAMQSTGCR